MRNEQVLTDNSRSALYSHLKSGASFAVIAISGTDDNEFEQVKVDIRKMKSWFAFIEARYIYEMDGKTWEKWELLLFISGIQIIQTLKLAQKYSKPSILFCDGVELKIIYCKDLIVSGEIKHRSGAVAQTFKSENETDMIKNAFINFRIGELLLIGDGAATIIECKEVFEYITPSPTEARIAQKNGTDVMASKFKLL